MNRFPYPGGRSGREGGRRSLPGLQYQDYQQQPSFHSTRGIQGSPFNSRGGGQGSPSYLRNGGYVGQGHRGSMGSASRGLYSPPAAPVDITYRVVIPPPREVQLEDPNCVCNRKVEWVICKHCAFIVDNGKARVSRLCPAHPNRVPYSDLSACPKCSSAMLEESVISNN